MNNYEHSWRYVFLHYLHLDIKPASWITYTLVILSCGPPNITWRYNRIPDLNMQFRNKL